MKANEIIDEWHKIFKEEQIDITPEELFGMLFVSAMREKYNYSKEVITNAQGSD